MRPRGEAAAQAPSLLKLLRFCLSPGLSQDLAVRLRPGKGASVALTTSCSSQLSAQCLHSVTVLPAGSLDSVVLLLWLGLASHMRQAQSSSRTGANLLA